MKSTAFWVAQSTFLITGIFMIIINYQENAWGGNYGWGFLSAVSQYSGMLLFGVLYHAIETRSTGLGILRSMRKHWKLIVPIALSDFADTFLHNFGLNNAGAGLYIVFFSSVTIWVALIRRFILHKQITSIQWIAVVTMTAMLMATGIEVQAKSVDGTVLFGMLMSLGAALCDAVMYVLAERAFDVKDGPTENEVSTFIGALNLCLTGVYIALYSAGGRWADFVEDRIAQKGGHSDLVIGFWAMQSVIFFGHYLSFYFAVSSASSIVAGVNKALQSAGVFLVSAALYCSKHARTECNTNEQSRHCTFKYDSKNCLTPLKIAACVTVSLCVVLFSYGKAKPSLSIKFSDELTGEYEQDISSMGAGEPGDNRNRLAAAAAGTKLAGGGAQKYVRTPNPLRSTCAHQI
jgi:drug/metabolite transporter (DMT)-like permease